MSRRQLQENKRFWNFQMKH